MKNNQKLLIGGAIIAALVLIGGFAFATKKHKVEAPEITQTAPLEEVQAKPRTSVRPQTPAPTTPAQVVNVTLTYDQAVAKYANGHLVQLDQNCQSYPHSMSIANGATLMIDNRASKDEVVSLAGTQIAIPGYGFKVITLNAPTSPTTYNMSCLGSTNINTITVE